jgi:S-adenosylmethionine/arginine decarboxylase-like enzyme
MIKCWGVQCSVDLYGCDPESIRSAKRIKAFVIELCDLIDMKRYGEANIVRFGAEERVAGYSMFQLIETSNISAHFVEETDNAYIDVFSCKMFDAMLVEDFCKRFFKATDSQMVVNYRK